MLFTWFMVKTTHDNPCGGITVVFGGGCAQCYETVPRKEIISHAFINLMRNIQEYNAGKI